MIKPTVVQVSDTNYISHSKALFGSIRTVGNFKGDLCLISNGISEENLKVFIDKGCKIFKLPSMVNPFFAKLYLFDEFFKQWDVVAFFDCDFVILKDINILFEQNGEMFCDEEPFTIGQYLSNEKDLNLYEHLSTIYNMNSRGFNSSCMIYNTDIIKNNLLLNLLSMKEICKPINKHTGLEEGTDQPILNIVFYNKWKNTPYVCFHRKRKPEAVAIHTCRWEAPWKDPRYINHYRAGLEAFERL